MKETLSPSEGVVAPRVTLVLVGILALGVLIQAAFAGGFLSGDRVWLNWHENLGDVLVLVPFANLAVGLVAHHRHPGTTTVLPGRVALVLLVVTVVATGHAGRNLLALHIPAAVALAGLIVHQMHQAVVTIRATGHQLWTEARKPMVNGKQG